MTNPLRTLIALATALLLSASLAAGTLIGAFDVGPGGSPVPSGPWYNTAGNTWISKMWTPLVSLNETASGLSPQLATSWEANDDYTVWTFTLREGVTWHDGEAFTADDVVFTWHHAFAPESAASPERRPADLVGQEAYSNGDADTIAGIEALDDYTVRFTTAEPAPRFPNTLTQAYILPEHAADFAPSEFQTTDWWFTDAVGTGPFQHDAFVPDESWTLVPNPGYWNGAPQLDRLINRYFADETAAILALESGDIHFTYASGDVAVGLGEQPRFELYDGPSGVTNYMMFNYRTNPLFDDIRVRQAFLHAIDRETIAEVVLNGTAQVVPCIVPFEAYWPETYETYDYDPERARSLLAEAGWDSSQRVEVKTYYGSQFHADAMAAMQQFLAEAGLNVDFIVDSEGYNSYFYDGRNWEISYRGLGIDINAFPYSFYERGGYPGSEGDTGTLMGKALPELEAIFAEARPEGDPEQYRSLMQDVCAWQNENALEAYMWTAVRFGVADAELEGFYWYPAPAGGPYEDHPERWSAPN